MKTIAIALSATIFTLTCQAAWATDYELPAEAQEASSLSNTQINRIYRDCTRQVSAAYCNDLILSEFRYTTAGRWLPRENAARLANRSPQTNPGRQ
ncbi:hypothetical protein [Gloeobacter kilaueensis]|uniref:Uncharacterized protein n=1 Tax=Gloeobacter kilaueensis (strain ATCC BAA-2537 / CCAP 1431/1 / ULC 316 / JS1) TaxID=1183438 RepID=U5QGL6_GLOK1|nr:hypothetical protein [Gloeobacter kilaueensis]AGY56774.1 hypothetical protein GKIL_0528 [Gloeobacter kilaueensis JS1]